MLNRLRHFLSTTSTSSDEQKVTHHIYSPDPIVNHYIQIIEEVRVFFLDAIEDRLPYESILLWSFDHHLKNHDVYLDINELSSLSEGVFLHCKNDASTLYEWLTDEEVNTTIDLIKSITLQTAQNPRRIMSMNKMLDQYAQAFREDILYDVNRHIQWEKLCGYNVGAWIHRANNYEPESAISSKYITVPSLPLINGFVNPRKRMEETIANRFDLLEAGLNNRHAYEEYLHVVLRYTEFEAFEQIKQEGIDTLLTKQLKEFSQWAFTIRSQIYAEMEDRQYRNEIAKIEALDAILSPIADALINAIIFPHLVIVNTACHLSVSQAGEMLVIVCPFRNQQRSIFRLQHIVNRTLSSAKSPEVLEKVFEAIMENNLKSFGTKFFTPFDIDQNDTEQETK